MAPVVPSNLQKYKCAVTSTSVKPVWTFYLAGTRTQTKYIPNVWMHKLNILSMDFRRWSFNTLQHCVSVLLSDSSSTGTCRNTCRKAWTWNTTRETSPLLLITLRQCQQCSVSTVTHCDVLPPARGEVCLNTQAPCANVPSLTPHIWLKTH